PRPRGVGGECAAGERHIAPAQDPAAEPEGGVPADRGVRHDGLRREVVVQPRAVIRRVAVEDAVRDLNTAAERDQAAAVYAGHVGGKGTVADGQLSAAVDAAAFAGVGPGGDVVIEGAVADGQGVGVEDAAALAVGGQVSAEHAVLDGQPSVVEDAT